MVIGILQIELTIEGARSIKDKRRVVNSLKDRLHREHQVSVAEVDEQDNARTAILGIGLVSTTPAHAQSILDRMVDKIEGGRGYVLADHTTEILSGR
jgi:uncharacterized protein YlxP (DUF503 family)